MVRRRKRWYWDEEKSDSRYTGNVIGRASSGWRRCLQGFATWLEEERGLAAASVTVRVASVRTFLEGQEEATVRGLRCLDARDIEDFFIGYAENHGPGATRSMQAALRLFLRFAAGRGWVCPTLADVVPSMRSVARSRVPHGLSDEEVRAVVAATATGTNRDRALVVLIATYGVRRGQVSALDLDDIDWRARTVRFAEHKRGKEVLHALTAFVADTLAKYIRSGRPGAETPAVFVTTRPPFRRLSPSAITEVVRKASGRAELDRQPCGPHTLRHSFATRMIRQGESLKTIADLLGHRSLESVATYAKLDHPRLLEVATEWPESTP